MNKSAIDLIGAIFSIFFGFYCAIFYRSLGRRAVETQRKFFHLHYNVAGFQIAFLIGGISFIVFGMLQLLSVAR